MLTKVYRPVDEPQAHRQPVENLSLPLHPALREGFVHNPQQEVRRQSTEGRWCTTLRWEWRWADRFILDVRRRAGKHQGFLVEDDHLEVGNEAVFMAVVGNLRAM